MIKLYSHQRAFLSQKPDKSALVWSCGTGKTLTSLLWFNKAFMGLVICPKALKANWQREIQRTGVKAAIYTKEEFRKEWKNLPAFVQIVVDEVHNGFLTPHFKSQMSKSLRDYIKKHKIRRVLLLSATVYTSSPWNIYNLAFLLGQKWDWFKFNQTFFTQVRMGPRIIPIPKKGIEPKLAELTKKIASIVDIKNVIDVPLQEHCEPEYFALTKEQEKAIEDNYDPLPIVRYTQEHEIENGVLLANEFRKEETYENDKIERIKALCEENKKIAIVCRYNAQIDYLAKELRSYKPLIIRGDVKDRDAVTRTAELSSNCVVLIQADSSLGYELPSFPVCVFASMSYSYVNWEQMCGRFLRMNKPSRTVFMYLLTEGDSVDQAVYDAIKRKEDFSINLFKR